MSDEKIAMPQLQLMSKAQVKSKLAYGQTTIKGFEDFFIWTQEVARATGYQSVTNGYAPSERHLLLKACGNLLKAKLNDYILVQGDEADKLEVWREKAKVK